MATAIITGGSSGLGLNFAQALAGRGIDLILIARDEVKLQRVCQALEREYQVNVRSVVANLSDSDSVELVSGLITKTKNLDYMINNAGFATHVDAADHSRRAHRLQQDAMTVMALNTLIFSSTAATVMRKQGFGHIINIASTAAWTFQGTYSAIKSYVLVYTQSLSLSLEGTGATATAVCPAWMHTNFHRAAGLGEPAIPKWLYVQPAQVVKEALKKADRGRSVVIPTMRWRLIIWCLGHGPVALRRQISRVYTNSSNYGKKSRHRNKRPNDKRPIDQ